MEKLKFKLPFDNQFLSLWISRIITFHFVCFAWIFFRSQTFDDAILILKQLASADFISSIGSSIVLLSGFWLLFFLYPSLVRGYHYIAQHHQKVAWYYYPIPLAVILTLVFMLAPSGMPGFIYANF